MWPALERPVWPLHAHSASQFNRTGPVGNGITGDNDAERPYSPAPPCLIFAAAERIASTAQEAHTALPLPL